jgi:hypothetical protein
MSSHSDPPLASTSYLARFINGMASFDVHSGLVTFSNRLTISDSGDPDETPPNTVLAPVPKLPDAVTAFLVSSRCCDTGKEKLADFAWRMFGGISGHRQ